MLYEQKSIRAAEQKMQVFAQALKCWEYLLVNKQEKGKEHPKKMKLMNNVVVMTIHLSCEVSHNWSWAWGEIKMNLYTMARNTQNEVENLQSLVKVQSFHL